MFKLNFSHFQTYLLSTFIVPNFFKFWNHLTINSKKNTIVLLCYLKLFSIYFFLLVSNYFDCLLKLFFKDILPCFHLMVFYLIFLLGNYLFIGINYFWSLKVQELDSWKGQINKEYKFGMIFIFFNCNGKFKPYPLACDKQTWEKHNF
jgi:hypothetical protein